MIHTFIKRYRSEIIGAVVCLAGGIISGFLFKGTPSNAWYMLLSKPTYTPPNWVFAPIWSVLYIMMGVALGKLWNNRSNNQLAIGFFVLQYAYNMMWTPLFFHWQRIDLALMDIYLLLGSIIILMYLVRRQRSIFLLLVPYVLWVAFATMLNFNMYNLNVM